MKETKKPSLVYGVGINDADYVVQPKTNSGRSCCPYYSRWTGMLERCYSSSWLKKHPSYIGCSVVKDWAYFSNFALWMKTQDWEGKQLDKDILIRGNKIYGPETCVFIKQDLNKFLTERGSERGKWPIGVFWHKRDQKFIAQARCVVTGKRVALGHYDTPEEAHKAWLAFKLVQAYILAADQTDQRVALALIDRYENYTETRGVY